MKILTRIITCASLLPLSLLSYAADETVSTPSIKFNASIMLDHDTFEEGFLEDGEHGDNDSEVRRARLGLSSQLSENWKAKVKVDVSDEVEVKDAYIAFSGWKWADITVGKQKEPFGLEKQMSSRNTFMIERSMSTNAIAPGRTLGAALSGKNNNINWQVGYFQDDSGEKSNAITGRITWAPLVSKDQVFHFGLSASERSLHDEYFRINESMEVHTADSNLEGKKLTADKSSLLGTEFIWKYKSLTTMAEWQMSDVENDSGDEYRYEGGYYQMSYLFGGNSRKYKNGMLGGINAKNTWEATVRYSQFKLVEERDKAKTFSIGVNYLFTKDFKIMANYIHAERNYDGQDLNASDALSFRVQYRF